MKEELLKIINHYGVNHQQRKLAEEIFELQEAITTYELFEDNSHYITNCIAEELADCFVLLNQIALYYGIDKELLILNEKIKVDRQLERIKHGD